MWMSKYTPYVVIIMIILSTLKKLTGLGDKARRIRRCPHIRHPRGWGLRAFKKAFFSLLILSMWTACSPPPVARDFAVEALLLTAQDLPPRWQLQGHYVTGCPSQAPCPRSVAKLPLSPELATQWQRNGTNGAREDVFAEFDLIADDGHTVLIHGTQGVLLYRAPDIAQSQYRRDLDVYQFSSLCTWEELAPALFTSQYATTWRIGCCRESQTLKEKCLYVAVYEELLVDLAWIIRDEDAGDTIHQEDFVALVRTLDHKIGHCMYNTQAE